MILTAFETLDDIVQSLKTSEASQASLDHLETRVTTLTAKQQALDGLDVKGLSWMSIHQSQAIFRRLNKHMNNMTRVSAEMVVIYRVTQHESRVLRMIFNS